ncbi:hypothetical protein ACKKBJ_04550 [Aeromonas dhakensis]|uniref:hypothetical protein n=1 Tax=Aeromonas dhakensis TaxID=196024 RepID=UPI00059EC160|nr:hypothetical protein [Aeromonas dhakensis]
MINFLSSVALDSFYLTSVDFHTTAKEGMTDGHVSFGNKITLMTPSDMPLDKVEYIKLNIEVNIEGKDDESNGLFKLKSEYEAFFRVVNNKVFFENDLRTRSHYCFSLVYPFVIDDILPLLKRAGVDSVALPLSSTVDDIIS